eukprot:TRINITY_DN4019_c0_g1_i4.p1 TRINITY_DN4019_c0_g1~~TRINITY_DN4019_c0_g1_i4.p1  ORF type:complete len:233 (+),score=27.00 TRINITY_DN4019_c0_g1_i4:454-1152(+)
MKLMREGKMPGMPEGPCDYILDMEPGMVPLQAGSCPEPASPDCLASLGRPGEGAIKHPMGLQGAFTQVATSSQVRAMNIEHSFSQPDDVCNHDQTLQVRCPEDDCKVFGEEGASLVLSSCKLCGIQASKFRSLLGGAQFLPNYVEVMAQFTVPSQIIYLCDHILGSGSGSCKYVFDRSKCSQGTNMTEDTCYDLVTVNGLTGDDAKTYLEYTAMGDPLNKFAISHRGHSPCW